MSDKHTPGPWRRRGRSVTAGSIRISQSGFVGGACQQIQQAAENERVANAALIAAAPDLLEALTAFSGEACVPRCDSGQCAYCNAAAAVEKATREG